MRKMKVAVTIRSFDKKNLDEKAFTDRCEVSFFNSTGKRLNEDELIRALDGAEAVIAGTESFSRNVLTARPGIRIISRVGVGLDSIDKETAETNHLVITTTPFSPIVAVAEHTIALLLSIMKRITKYDSNMRKGEFGTEPGSLLAGKTVGIVGMGRIGRKVAGYLECFQCRIWYYDPVIQEQPSAGWRRASTLEDLVENSDILLLHAPPRPDGSPIINGEILRRCRPGIILVNTSRGSVLDEDALTKHLDSGRVSGAGLDVFSIEPYRGPLLRYPQVVVTPHVASNTSESRVEMEREAVKNLLNAVGGVLE